MNELAPSEITPTSKIKSDIAKPKVGDWFWVTTGERRWFACVTHIGTNYVKVESPGHSEERIHANEFRNRCEFEPDPNGHILKMTQKCHTKLNRLTGEIQQLTSELGLANVSLTEGVSALATQTGNGAVKEYQTALALAKDKTLPDLFREVRDTSDNLKTWLSATTVPLRAQIEGFSGLIKSVENRIFNVELYAGLVETVALIADGKEAPIGEKVRLMQRRAYMDEECLAEYQTGGMDFDGIEEFDAWMAKPENYTRILPLPRCVIAFRVRRNDKEREGITFHDYINIIGMEQADKSTFLYLRNGEKLYRLQTQIDFGAKLFPDIETAFLDSQCLYAEAFCDRVQSVISEHQYLGMVEDEKRKEAELAELLKNTPEDEHWKHGHVYNKSKKYSKFTPDNVLFDDIEEFLKEKVDAHNRLVVVLQGLMDRSPVFHPHPKYSLWKGDDFNAAIELIHDDSRALVSGTAPDFEVFRRELNKSLCEGCVTVGQEDGWEKFEAEKECRRRDSDYRNRDNHYRPTRYRPYGNPGPGRVATVASYGKRSGRCTYKWQRERQTYSRYRVSDDPIECSITLDALDVLNVSAYKPGMFKQFFADPRTRANYLQWAPLLLAAEEYHAGRISGRRK